MKRLGTLLMGATLLLAGCAAPTDGESLTIGLTYIPDVQFAPFYVAEAEGFFAAEGVTVDLRHHGASEALFGALTAGEEDLVVAGADEMLQARSQGTDVRAVGVLYQHYPIVIAARATLEASTMGDLAGHAIGLPGPFGENWFGLLALLEDAGMTEDDVRIEHIGYTQQAAMASGAVDAVVAFSNNDLVGLEAAGIDTTVVSAPELPLVSIAVGASGTTVEDHADELAGIIRALERSIEFIVAEPDATMDIVAEHVPEFDAVHARRVLDATIPLYGEDPLALDPAKWEPMYQFMREHDLIAEDIDPADAYSVLDLAP